jgi:polysaccharide export outer membrane protein
MAYARGTSPASVEDILIKPGDVIHVERAGMIYVLGAVNRPGAYLMQEDGKLDVTQAIALAFGTALQASTGSIRVIRREVDGKLTEIPVLYGRTMKAKESPIILHAEDIIYVPPSKVKTALMDSQSVMSSAASATIYRF